MNEFISKAQKPTKINVSLITGLISRTPDRAVFCCLSDLF